MVILVVLSDTNFPKVLKKVELLSVCMVFIGGCVAEISYICNRISSGQGENPDRRYSPRAGRSSGPEGTSRWNYGTDSDPAEWRPVSASCRPKPVVRAP